MLLCSIGIFSVTHYNLFSPIIITIGSVPIACHKTRLIEVVLQTRPQRPRPLVVVTRYLNFASLALIYELNILECDIEKQTNKQTTPPPPPKKRKPPNTKKYMYLLCTWRLIHTYDCLFHLIISYYSCLVLNLVIHYL